MPNNYDYTEAKRLISQSRLSTYHFTLSPKNDAQLLGAYTWNLAVISAFYPLIQLIEIALRNAINSVAVDKVQCSEGKNWFECILSAGASNERGEAVESGQVSKFKRCFINARRSATKLLREKGIEGSQPTLDQIISQTDFATWEYILDKHFYDGSNNHFLWPVNLSKCFRKLPRYEGKNAMFHQRDIIRRRIEEVRTFRNRISHNEPAWRSAEASSREEVIQFLTDKLTNMMELLFWIAPKFNRYVIDIGIESRILQLLNDSELNRLMHITEAYEIPALESFIGLTKKANEENLRCHFIVDQYAGVLYPKNTRL